MKLLHMEKVRDGKYLKNYELLYENRAGRQKTFELVSRKDLKGPADLGKEISGVSIVAFQDKKMLLLREFRMSLNKEIFNLCAGMLEEGETIEDCIRRELYEETGLKLVKTCIAFVETQGECSDHASENEQIRARFYDAKEIRELLGTAEFSSRSQMAAYFFASGMIPGKPAQDAGIDDRAQEGSSE